ncbi:hypothetical protein AB3S75_021402 [Citrus x aurantiifolia]
MKLANQYRSLVVILVVVSVSQIFDRNGEFVRLTEAGKSKVHITDDLDDVIDDEEDDDWKEWGKPKTSGPEEFDPPKLDFDSMNIPQMQEEMLKRQFGPVFGFVKLRLGTPRSVAEVMEIATKWSKVLKTGSIEVKFMAIDFVTIMFTLQRGQDVLELREFLLKQPEAYEVKIGDQAYRRPGDPPLEKVIQKLQNENNKDDADDGRAKEEL